MKHAHFGIPGIVIPMDAIWLAETRLPGRCEAAGIQRDPEPIGLPKHRPDAVQVRVLANIPLGLVSPDRDKVARLAAMLMAARLIMHWNVHLGF